MVKAYVASYGEGEKKGIYVVEMNETNGQLSLLQHLETEDYPSYIIKRDDYLYASMKNATKKTVNGGLAIFDTKDKVKMIEKFASGGRSYTHLCITKDKQKIFVANYHVGTTAAYALNGNQIIAKTDVVHHDGKGPDPKGRQKMPHVHYVGITPDEKYLYSVDLGSDKIVLYDYNFDKLKLVRKQDIVPGSGPRHMIFSEDGRFAYLINEIANNIMVFRYHAGMFTMVQMISTLPRHFKGESSAAAIRISKSGTHLFVSNRGHDSIAMYSVNKETGKLFLLYMVHTGKDPRDFNIYDDKYLVVGSQTSNWLEVLKLDLPNDIMERTGAILDLPAPVCIEF